MTRFFAFVATLSILAFMAVYAGDGAVYLAYVLAGVAMLAVTVLLSGVFLLVSRNQRWNRAVRYWMQAHVLLHLVPVSYLVLQFFTRPSLQINLFYLAPVLLFFYSGRQTWRVLFEQFGSRMYRVFLLGNTGMMAGHVVLISLGVVFDAKFGAEFFCRVLLAYFTIHLLILGVAVVKIERDLRADLPDSV